MIKAMQNKFIVHGSRIALAVVLFSVLCAAILTRPAKWLSDFDQSFYLTVAYDLLHHGVFSNGVFDTVDSTLAVPPPGKFFGPVYPWLVAAIMKIDPRFARAVNCSVEANHKTLDGRECDVYAFPIHLLHAIFLTLGVVAIAGAGERIFESKSVFWISGLVSTLALLPDADLFSFAMTESITFCLYSIAALVFISGLKASSISLMFFSGCFFGVLVLTRASFAALAPVLLALIVIHGLWVVHTHWKHTASLAMALAIGWTAMVGPWLVRNAISTGHWGLTEEYGSAALIERFAFNKMSVQETALAFPYCLPGIGEPLVHTLFGPKAMERFVYYSPDSFFHVGRAHRDKLVEIYGRLDPLIGTIAKQEITQNWWRHLVISLPLAWCGMWVGGWLGLLAIPLFFAAIVFAVRETNKVFAIYCICPLVMLGLHGLLANHYTRYNLVLIGPISVGAGWMISKLAQRLAVR